MVPKTPFPGLLNASGNRFMLYLDEKRPSFGENLVLHRLILLGVSFFLLPRQSLWVQFLFPELVRFDFRGREGARRGVRRA